MSFPTSVPFTALNFTSVTPTLINRTLSGLESRARVASQYFQFTADFQNLTETQRKTLMGFIASSSGNLNTFTIALPEPLNDSSAGYSGTITGVTASAGATSCSGTVTSSGAAIVKAGDLIKFSNHNKIYMVTADATAVSTTVTINFFPALRTAVSSGSITHTNLEMTVRMVTDELAFSMSQDMYASFALEFIEVL